MLLPEQVEQLKQQCRNKFGHCAFSRTNKALTVTVDVPVTAELLTSTFPNMSCTVKWDHQFTIRNKE